MATKTRFYRVAGIPFSVVLNEDRDVDAMLPSFAGFEIDPIDNPAFVLDAEGSVDIPPETEIITEDDNDMGLVRLHSLKGEEYYLSLVFAGCEDKATFSKDWTQSMAMIDWSRETAGNMLSSVLRMQFSQVALAYDAVSLHASTVVKDGKGFLFMGKSGTGKSTHSRQWLKAFPGTYLLNDDNPSIRIEEGSLKVYGTPWSGKTPCYRNETCPVGGIARLSQSPRNRFYPLEDVAAFVEVYKGCSVLRTVPYFHDRLCDVLSEAVGLVPVGHLECLPDEEAARVCHDGFMKKDLAHDNF